MDRKIMFAAVLLIAALIALHVLQEIAEDMGGEMLNGSCRGPEDCEGLPRIMCVGEWACEDGECVWKCEEGPST